MAKDKITFSFKCKKCGEPLTWDDKLPDSAVVECGKCGAKVATLGQMKAEAMKRAKVEVGRMVTDVFKNSPFKRR